MHSTHRIVSGGDPEQLTYLLSTPIEPAVLTNIARLRESSAQFLAGCVDVDGAGEPSERLISKRR